MRKVGLASALVAAILALVPGSAAAQTDSRQTADLRFSEQRPGAASGLTLSIDYRNPTDPDGKPPAVRNVVEELADGARIDTSIPDLCTATDPQLMVQGAAACPLGSRVGTGSIRLDTGLVDPARFIDADVVFLNNTDQLIFLSTERLSGARAVTRSSVQGRQIVNSAPILPGTPPDGAAIDLVHVQIEPVSREIDGVDRGYVTTPGACPPSGGWTNSISFTYADGVSETASSTSPCVGLAHAAAAGPEPASKKCKNKKRKQRAGRKGKKRKRCKKKR